ncbi:HAD family hydrolase [Streptomyces sp. AK02-01A]|uniref:HAD family hydrolase n=1 Tax=Streptomyces sp. AK02-01A TaxID=3028648 RepID=UPI0029ADA2BF|nr:haloacid dehalogenase-like hydrolase [Streptomyces sp. AK02-01A]MDX3855785.1 haloacid dehalogenase-like hydrolase [Streptomyces sp. AK02-01A]
MILVLWDIDRTLLYAGGIDRMVYQELFQEIIGRAPEALPAKGTGITMPLAVRELLSVNGIPNAELDHLSQRIVARMPDQLDRHRDALRAHGYLMPGAVTALATVRRTPWVIPSVVTGNLRGSAEIKLSTFGLSDQVEIAIGGYASDDSHRPALVRIAQGRAQAAYGHRFTWTNTVIVGDSLEDVRTGREGGARVIGIASGTTSAQDLAGAGADHVLRDLKDADRLVRLITAVGGH